MDRFVATSRSAQRSGTVTVILAALGGALFGAALVYFLVPSPAPAVETSPAAAAPADPAAELALTENTKDMYRAEIDRLLDAEQKLTLDLEDCRISRETVPGPSRSEPCSCRRAWRRGHRGDFCVRNGSAAVKRYGIRCCNACRRTIVTARDVVTLVDGKALQRKGFSPQGSGSSTRLAAR